MHARQLTTRLDGSVEMGARLWLHLRQKPGVVHVESYNAVQLAGEMTYYSMAELLVLIAEKKPLVWGRLRELQIQFLLLEGIFQCQEEHFLLSALAIDE